MNMTMPENKYRDELKRDIAEGRVQLRFQPQINCRTGALIGAEVLSRFTDLYGKPLKTQERILYLEDTQQIHTLDFHMFEQVCRHISEKLASKEPVCRLSVNFSKHTLLLPDFVPQLIHIWRKYNVPTSCFLIELTETALRIDQNKLFKQLGELRELGISFSMDDFGASGTPLSLLSSHFIDELKLDKSLTDTLLVNPTAWQLCKMIARFCRDAGLFTVVEGVDSKEKLDAAFKLGFDAVQGYYIAKPMSMEDFSLFCSSYLRGDKPLMDG